MAIFTQASRYVQNASIYKATDRRGRRVPALTAAGEPVQALLGEHLRHDGQRLDHLAGFYLQDASAFWRLCEINDVLLPDALAETDTVKIPEVL